jgi:deoxyribodipyrimidine photolyase-related protein
MNESALIFPHQLFEDNPLLKNNRVIYLIEDPLFFGDSVYPTSFHKQKLLYHRLSMKSYQQELEKKGFRVEYVNYTDIPKKSSYLEKIFKKAGKIHYIDTVDFILEKRIRKSASALNVELNKLNSPAFLLNEDWLKNYYAGKKKYFLNRFYIDVRKELGVLVENGKPVGGKWSFDTENRKKLPKNHKVPNTNFVNPPQRLLKEAFNYVDDNFKDNPGKLKETTFPIDHKSAAKWLDDFLNERFQYYGDYQDAIVKDESYLYHSLISPMLNTGLLTPRQVVDAVLGKLEKIDLPLNAVEGFIRQIIGWREFIRAIYIFDGSKQRTSNFWENHNPMPKAFYTGETGIPPVDKTIKRLVDSAYNHHIERLMILGNFMLLCEINPDEVYKWFMEMYIDAYDWVMVPNVYGMSQFADGGFMSTKPYISSSNYVLKMSDYPKGEWTEVWNGLFWRFVYKHYEFFSSNPRTQFMAGNIRKMSKEKLDNHINIAEQFLEKLYA